MWDDLKAGIKPAMVIAAMYLRGSEVNRMNRESLKAFLEEVKKDFPKWLYPACKATQHGSCYGMGTTTMSNNILLQSWKQTGQPIHVSPSDCGKLQNLFMNHRYVGVKLWQESVARQLIRTSTLTCASGHTRTFFGRRRDNATLQSAYSQEPQANTTYATNLALRNLWYDAENRDANDFLIVEPLHQVHDAIVGQFPLEKLDWAVEKIKSWFQNEIEIAGQKLVIPFEGHYGPSWGEMEKNI